MPYCVYVIENKSGRRYIGCSDNVQRRLAQHNAGISNWTRGKGPWRLVWIRANLSLADARKLENLLKRQGRGLGFYKITGLFTPS
ncbi:MAG: GIY-YIG nuclease family protein [Verrucomicrobiota bacterium]